MFFGSKFSVFLGVVLWSGMIIHLQADSGAMRKNTTFKYIKLC